MPRDRGWDFGRLTASWGPGSSASQFGSFLDDGADFDPEFFGIAERDALAMHPVQRLALITSWEAFEDAGIIPASYRSHDVAVFVGFFGPEDYGPRWHNAHEGLRGRVVIGSSPSVLAGRLSYFYGFHGPSATLDTACSGSLVGVHLACQSLRTGEADLALAGGATFHGLPGVFTEFSRQGALAPDGRCKSFADAADGTGWGEGAGMVVLARLSDARRLGYRVHAVIRGSAVNHDGRSRTLSAPSQEAQERLILKALRQADLEPSEVDVMEAHGTGTRLGDPIEAAAILATYGQRSPGRPLMLGSAKPNIGHTLAAAGVGGLIKMVMALRHGIAPRTLHAERPNQLIDWSTGTVRLITENMDWPESDRARRAAVSSFGVSGTNAHVIIEAVPAADDRQPQPAGFLPWVLSAHTDQALRDLAHRIRACAAGSQVADIGFSLATARSRFARRAVVLGREPSDFQRGLELLASGQSNEDVIIGGGAPVREPAFVFPGQGTQWPGMGVELAEQSPAFRQRLNECAETLAIHCDWYLLDALRQPALLERVDVVQPALFAVMVALAVQWEAYGVRPAAVVGHSQGEIAAACVAGALTLPDAARVVALRSQALATLADDHGMAAVSLGPKDIQRYPGLSVAAVNGPGMTVLAGPKDRLRRVVADVESRGERARMLPVDYASHSDQVEAVRERILDGLADVTPQAGRLPIYSAVTGERIDGTELTAEYWYRNLRQPVRFDLAVQRMHRDGLRCFLESSPHPVLTSAIETMGDVAVVGTLRRDEGAHRFLRSVAEAYAHGVEFDAAGVFGQWRPQRVDLPTYPFQSRRLWIEPDPGHEPSGVGHSWLFSKTPLADREGFVLTGGISLRRHPWLTDHQVRDHVVVPGAGVVDLMLTAGREAGAPVLSELVQHRPIVVSADLQLQIVVDAPAEDDSLPAHLYTRTANEQWTHHADGVLVSADATPVPELDCPSLNAVDPAEIYRASAEAGIQYGPAFRAVRAAWRHRQELFADVELTIASEPFSVHPVLLDAALHGIALSASGQRDQLKMLPFRWTGVRLHGASTDSARVRVTALPNERFALRMDDTNGKPLLTVDALEMRPLTGLRLGTGTVLRREWRRLPTTPCRVHTATVLRAQGIDVLTELQARLKGGGDRFIVLTKGAVSTRPDEDVVLDQAAIWGLVRSAQTENPGRITLIDWDEKSDVTLTAAMSRTDELQLAVRDSSISAPHLVPATRMANPRRLQGTVLITGGTGLLGSKVARHLVARHGTHRLVLTSRRGMAAPGAQSLVDSLNADIKVVACDVSDRDSVAQLLRGIPDLTAIVHAAGLLADGLVGDLKLSDVQKVMRAKAEAARHLHELTRDRELDAFILFSSTAATFGNIGQGNYAAANAYLEGLAQHRRTAGLPATALAWGLWQDRSELTANVANARTFARLTPGVNLGELTDDAGLALFDEFWHYPEASTVVLVDQLSTDTEAPPEDMAERLRGLDSLQRRLALRDLITSHVTAVLGERSAAALTDNSLFRDVGMESLDSVEVRNRLGAALGRRLPVGVIFDYPTPARLAEHLDALLVPGEHSLTDLSEEDVDGMDIQSLIGYFGQ
jgi:acyl transferase domain-containing protein/acyl carrier protein